MARGKKCPHCGEPMWAESEKDHPAGTEVVYKCFTSKCGGFREKVFEDKR